MVTNEERKAISETINRIEVVFKAEVNALPGVSDDSTKEAVDPEKKSEGVLKEVDIISVAKTTAKEDAVLDEDSKRNQ